MAHHSHTDVSRATFLSAAAGLVLAACAGSSGTGGGGGDGGGDGDGGAGAGEAAAPSSSPRDPAEPTTTASSGVPGEAAGSTVAAAVASVVPAALIGATAIDGEPFDAAALAGRPTVAWFWAPWCVVCRAEAPDVAEIAERYAGLVNFVGVAGLSELSAMREFVADTGTDGIIHLDDSSGEIWASYEIYSQPAFAFIADDGRLEVYVGTLGGDGLADIIDELIVA